METFETSYVILVLFYHYRNVLLYIIRTCMYAYVSLQRGKYTVLEGNVLLYIIRTCMYAYVSLQRGKYTVLEVY